LFKNLIKLFDNIMQWVCHAVFEDKEMLRTWTAFHHWLATRWSSFGQKGFDFMANVIELSINKGNWHFIFKFLCNFYQGIVSHGWLSVWYLVLATAICTQPMQAGDWQTTWCTWLWCVLKTKYDNQPQLALSHSNFHVKIWDLQIMISAWYLNGRGHCAYTIFLELLHVVLDNS